MVRGPLRAAARRRRRVLADGIGAPQPQTFGKLMSGNPFNTLITSQSNTLH